MGTHALFWQVMSSGRWLRLFKIEEGSGQSGKGCKQTTLPQEPRLLLSDVVSMQDWPQSGPIGQLNGVVVIVAVEVVVVVSRPRFGCDSWARTLQLDKGHRNRDRTHMVCCR